MSVQPLKPDAAGNPRCLIDWREGGRKGKRYRKVFCGSTEEARAWLDSRRYPTRRRRWRLPVSVAFPEAAAEFRSAKVAAERSEGYTRELDRLCEALAKRWAGLKVEEVSPRDIEEWLGFRRGEGAGARTREKEWAELRTFFRWARRRGYCQESPIEATEKPIVPEQPPKWLSPAEFARLWAAAPDYLRPILTALVVTGVRVGEVCSLRRADVHAAMVYNRNRKGNDWLASPANAALRQMFLEQPERPDGLVFTRPRIYQGQTARTDYWTPSSVYRAIQTAAVTAGLIPKMEPRQKRKPGEARRPRRKREACLGPHVLRHTCASWLVAAGVPIYTVRAILGHSTVTMTEKYAHLSLAIDWKEEAKLIPAEVSTKCPHFAVKSSESSKPIVTDPAQEPADFQREKAPKKRNPRQVGRVAERQTLRL